LREPVAQLEVEQVRLHPGQEWSPSPDQWRIILLQSGTAYWLDTTKPQELAGGELLILFPASKGFLRASQLTEVLLDWFAFQPSSLLGFFSVAERAWIEQCDAANGPVKCLPSTHAISTDVASFLTSRHTDCPLVERAKTLVFALRVITESMPFPNAVVYRSATASERFDLIISRMPDAEFIQQDSEGLARLCGCTTRHFNRLFRMRFGVPPRVRQTELRLVKASQLLRNSSETVAEIAAGCGYRSLRLFNSLFRRQFGMSPSQWRQQA
jgi:AraC-like DNA-binding protein